MGLVYCPPTPVPTHVGVVQPKNEVKGPRRLRGEGGRFHGDASLHEGGINEHGRIGTGNTTPGKDVANGADIMGSQGRDRNNNAQRNINNQKLVVWGGCLLDTP